MCVTKTYVVVNSCKGIPAEEQTLVSNPICPNRKSFVKCIIDEFGRHPIVVLASQEMEVYIRSLAKREQIPNHYFQFIF